MRRPPGKPPRTRHRPQPDSIEIEVERLDEEGLAVGRHGGKEVLVTGALPGERIKVAVEHQGQRRIAGRLQQVLRPAADRIKPPCPCAAACQSCSLIHMDYDAQLRFKEDKVRNALSGRPALADVRQFPIWRAPQPLGYRTNAKLVLAKQHGKLRIGLYRRGSHEVVDIGDCPLHHPLINRIVQVLREEIARQEVFLYNPVSGRGLLRYLLIRVSPALNRAMVTLVTGERDFRRIPQLAKWLQRKVPEVVAVHQNINSSAGNVIFGRETIRVLGAEDLFDQVGEVRLRISPGAFFQVNHNQASRIYELVRQWAAPGSQDWALDLYCGIGGIALHLARHAGKVIGIEVVEEAVRNARQNATLNGLGNCVFRAGDAAELIHDLHTEVPPGSVAVLNPPRSGCDPQVLEELAGLACRSLVYVSCNPATLARDLDLLAGFGYRTLELQPVDMFPQTAHVETVARLVRK